MSIRVSFPCQYESLSLPGFITEALKKLRNMVLGSKRPLDPENAIPPPDQGGQEMEQKPPEVDVSPHHCTGM